MLGLEVHSSDGFYNQAPFIHCLSFLFPRGYKFQPFSFWVVFFLLSYSVLCLLSILALLQIHVILVS